MDKFRIDIPEYIGEIISLLQAAGHCAYIVGGCVRDALLEKVPNDWDVCTSALPETVKSVLQGFNVYETGIAHGTVTAVKNGNICEITTFRSDGEYSDHRRPDSVEFTTDLKTDLSRRDFTINAMAYAPDVGIIDFFGGKDDLKSKTIRCVGKGEERFNEDALRIMRALRFSSSFGFSLEAETKNAIITCFRLIDHVAKERIYNEFSRLLCGEYTQDVLSEYPFVFERFLGTTFFINNIHKLKSAPSDFALRFALLFEGNDISNTEMMLKQLKTDNRTIENVIFLLSNGSFRLEEDNFAIRAFLSRFGYEKGSFLANFIFLSQNFPVDKQFKITELINSTEVINLSNLAINGKDILSLGISPGKEIKYILEQALNAVIFEKCKNEKTALISFSKEIIIKNQQN